MNTMYDYNQAAACITKLCSLSDLPAEERAEKFWGIARGEYGAFCEPHYDELFAKQDVNKLEYSDSNGTKRSGAHWTCEQVEDATHGKVFPEGTTKWDRYVAYNVMYSDLCRVLTESQILSVAYSFFFADEDFKGKNKIWAYMSSVD